MNQTFKKALKKLVAGTLVASLAFSSVIPHFVQALENKYMDGEFTGTGRGFRVFGERHDFENNNFTEQQKVHAKVTFSGNKINNIDILGLKYNEEKQEFEPDDKSTYIYQEDVSYLNTRREGKQPKDILELIKKEADKENGLENLLVLLKEIAITNEFKNPKVDFPKYSEMIKDPYKKEVIDTVSKATLTSMGLTEAVKEAQDLAAKAVNSKVVTGIKILEVPEEMKNFEQTDKGIVYQVLEGDKVSFDQLKVEVSYSNNEKETLIGNEIYERCLKIKHRDSDNDGHYRDLIKGKEIAFKNAGNIKEIIVEDPRGNAKGSVKVYINKYLYIANNLEYQVGEGEWKKLQLEPTTDKKNIFNDNISYMNPFVKINLSESDFNRPIHLRTTEFLHPRTGEKITRNQVSNSVIIKGINKYRNRLIGFNMSSYGVLEAPKWSLIVENAGNLTKDKEEKKTALQRKIKDAEIIIELEPIEDGNEFLSNIHIAYSKAEEILKNAEREDASKLAEALENLDLAIQVFEGNKPAQKDKETLIKELKDEVKSAKEEALGKLSKEVENRELEGIIEEAERKIEQNNQYDKLQVSIAAKKEIEKMTEDLFKGKYREWFVLAHDQSSYQLKSSEELKAYDDKAMDVKKARELIWEFIKSKADTLGIASSQWYTEFSKENKTEGKSFEIEIKLLKKLFTLIKEQKKHAENLPQDRDIPKPVGIKNFESILSSLRYAIENFEKKNTQLSAERISGKDRIATAIEISKATFAKASDVVLAGSFASADALAAGGLVGEIKAPILLTNTKALSKDVVEELKRLEAKTVTIVGGISVVSPNVEKELKKAGFKVERIAGKDRFETSLLVALEIVKKNPCYEVFVANGISQVDALTISPVTAIKKAPILLTNGKTLMPGMEKITQKATLVTLVGGMKAVPDGLVDKAIRISGENRFETALAIADEYFDTNEAILASGIVFADALAASPYAANKTAPILLSSKSGVDPKTDDFINNKIEKLFLMGGKNAIADYKKK